MKFLKGIAEIYEAFTIKFSIRTRIIIGVVFFGTLGLLALKSAFLGGDPIEDDTTEHNIGNVYLYEEIEFASEVYVKCIGINAEENEGVYQLNLFLDIEQWNTDFNVNQFELTTDMFELRLSDINAKSNMDVFVESLANATISAVGSVVLGGEFNVIESTADFAADYVTGSIENSSSDDGLVIDALPNTFEPYYPYEYMGETKTIKLSFELTEEFLSSSKSMVLSIDEGILTKQRNIFLVLRPDTQDYQVHFNLNGGTLDSDLDDINVEASKLVDLPLDDPTKSGSKFVFWTTELNDASTKVRSIYFPTYNTNEVFTLYAYYMPLIPDEDVVKINESVFMKEDNQEIKVTSVEYLSQITVKNEDLEDVEMNAPDGFKYISVNLSVNKMTEDDDHVLDNDNDFYLENDHSSLDVEDYYGYIENFESIKPVDDYSWIGIDIDEVGIYEFTLYFLVTDDIDMGEDMLFLEIDFYYGPNSKSILLQD